MRDERKTNPALHLFYVKQAVVHLRSIDSCLRKLESHANGNLHEAILALQNSKRNLLKENMAYVDAQEILDSLHLKR